MTKHFLTILALIFLIACATTQEPDRTVVRKKWDQGYWVQYPGGAQVYKPEAYWLIYSDGSSETVSKEEWDKYDVPVIRVIEADRGESAEK
jgi:hypothetical protein